MPECGSEKRLLESVETMQPIITRGHSIQARSVLLFCRHNEPFFYGKTFPKKPPTRATFSITAHNHVTLVPSLVARISHSMTRFPIDSLLVFCTGPTIRNTEPAVTFVAAPTMLPPSKQALETRLHCNYCIPVLRQARNAIVHVFT